MKLSNWCGASEFRMDIALIAKVRLWPSQSCHNFAEGCHQWALIRVERRETKQFGRYCRSSVVFPVSQNTAAQNEAARCATHTESSKAVAKWRVIEIIRIFTGHRTVGSTSSTQNHVVGRRVVPASWEVSRISRDDTQRQNLLAGSVHFPATPLTSSTFEFVRDSWLTGSF